MTTQPKISRRKRKAAERREKFIAELQTASEAALGAAIIHTTDLSKQTAREAQEQLRRGRRMLGLDDF
ncbi:hypothetical protein ABIC83_002785 [Roseateles asaccharophilus]|uniref:hypothetical protein n=1 Tax=Roseateles asaccharophilus TaxID=582607 RepID=UPI003834BBBB